MWSWAKRVPLGVGAAMLCLGLLTACGGDAEQKADLADLLDDHPYGEADARARIKTCGGQGWDVTWSRSSEFPNIWSVRLKGTSGADDRAVSVEETVGWEKGRWVLAPVEGVVPQPSNAAETTRPR
ncbi:hypothetical protein [Streptomyces sp. NPDC046887]|uniref:hypothetical protein n=1 Tax=Streptomyces sp. NPDC046887 TaxID=3155472 RepID=UPI0033C5F904